MSKGTKSGVDRQTCPSGLGICSFGVSNILVSGILGRVSAQT